MMGLDVVAYERAELLPEGEHSDDDEDCVFAFVYKGFEPSIAGLVAGRHYRVSGRDIHFCAGSYSGYGAWREALALHGMGVKPGQVWGDPEAWKDKPFYLLVNFADNEGTIGPEACARLAREFAEHRDRVRPLLEAEGFGYYGQKYDEWRQAFELAAGGGLVELR